MFKKKKFLIGGLIILAAVSYLGYTGFQRSATYYYAVSELVKPGGASYTGNVKVNGQVAPGSVQQDSARSLRFTLTEGGQSLPVIYEGAVPDAFKAGVDVVVEGRLNPTGVFQANAILTKCPSKYVPQ